MGCQYPSGCLRHGRLTNALMALQVLETGEHALAVLALEPLLLLAGRRWLCRARFHWAGCSRSTCLDHHWPGVASQQFGEASGESIAFGDRARGCLMGVGDEECEKCGERAGVCGDAPERDRWGRHQPKPRLGRRTAAPASSLKIQDKGRATAMHCDFRGRLEID